MNAKWKQNDPAGLVRRHGPLARPQAFLVVLGAQLRARPLLVVRAARRILNPNTR